MKQTIKLTIALGVVILISACSTTHQKYTGLGTFEESTLKIRNGHYLDKNGQLKPFYLPN